MIRFIPKLILVVLCILGFTTKQSHAQNSWVPAAYQYLQEKYENFDLKVSDFTSPIVTDEYTSRGISHIYYNQQWNGVPIYGRSLSVATQGEVLRYASQNYLSLEEYTKTAFNAPFDPNQIIIQADQFAGLNYEGDFVQTEARSEFQLKGISSISQEEIFIEKTYEIVEDELIPAWLVGIFHDDISKWWQYHINAETGALINKSSWTIECEFHHDHCEADHSIASHYKPMIAAVTNNTYEVFAEPIFSPLYGDRTIQSSPWDEALNASPYGWHDDDGVAGAEYTVTRGNNVRAVEDGDANNNGGYSPDGGANLDFQFPFDPADSPADYQDAAIVNLFYWNNLLHDIFYQYGFDEASGNFQENNYGNGGGDSDMVNADAQDGSGTNNANFSTPPDGANPRMQMFVWTVGTTIDFEVTSPAGIAGAYFATGANFGPSTGTFSGELVEATPADACTSITNGADISGKIALIDRGDCTFVSKVNEAQDNGAIAVVICNNVSGNPITMGGSDPGITIPSIMLSMTDCDVIKAEMPSVEIEFTLNDTGELDSDMDNSVIAHEYGHGISIRLTGGPNTSNCLSGSEQMGEGWSDFFGLVTSIEVGDLAETGKGIGSYLVNEPATGNGIRTYPYSTDMSINEHTYDDIKTETVPHGVGTVWAIMLWEMTWELINVYGFDPDLYNGVGGNNMAMALVIEGLKLQPCNPGFVDGRDAILAADDILYGGVNNCLIWDAFAKRGLGFSATQGSSSSRSDGNEAFDTPDSCIGDMTIEVATAAEMVTVGDTLEYVISTINVAASEATGVEITNVLPNGIEYVPGTLSSGSENNGTITSDLVTLATNEELILDFDVEVTAGATTSSINVYEDFEYDYSEWIISSGQGTDIFAYNTTNPFRGSGAFFVPNRANQNSQYLNIENIVLNEAPIFVFNHYYDTEPGKDGGMVEISSDGGTTWIDLGPAMLTNGYNGILEDGSNNDIDNRDAFTGQSNSYLRTMIDLAAYASSTVDIRFFFGTNDQRAYDGWYLDDIIIYDGYLQVNTACVNSYQGFSLCADAQTLILPDCEAFNRYFADVDNDGFGDVNTELIACTQPANSSINLDDCDDTDANTYPGAFEICNDGIDQDCNGIIDDCISTNCIVEDNEDLEAGWGFWVDGGVDCLRTINDAPFANSGVYCVRLRDNSSSSTVSTPELDFSIYETIQIDVSFITAAYTNGSKLFLESSEDGGATWTTVESWDYLADILNDTRYNESILLDGPFSSTTTLRFRNDASSDVRRVYLDDFYIEGCLPEGAPTCFDGILNQDETGIDCGGICGPCTSDGCVENYASANKLTGATDTAADFETNGEIESCQVIEANAIVDYDSQSEVTLEIGFETKVGAVIEIFIDGCNNGDGGNN